MSKKLSFSQKLDKVRVYYEDKNKVTYTPNNKYGGITIEKLS